MVMYGETFYGCNMALVIPFVVKPSNELTIVDIEI